MPAGATSAGRSAAWRIEREADLTVVRCAEWSDLAGIGHAFSTRVGRPGESFDCRGADPASSERARRLARAAAPGGGAPVGVRQVHGARVVDAAEVTSATQADAIVASRHPAAPAPMVRTADCVPLLLADPQGRAIAAVHAGWRGTAAGVALRAVEALERRGVRPAELSAALGPAIGGCCYAVGAEVARPVAERCGVGIDEIAGRAAGRWMLDLRRALRLQLRGAGLEDRRIHAAPWCTCCAAELFFSHRRDGPAAGRMLACIGWSRVPRVA